MGRVKAYVLELEQIKTGKFHRLPNAAALNVCAWLCLEGANHQWRKIPPGELSIDPEADERLGRVTGWAGAL